MSVTLLIERDILVQDLQQLYTLVGLYKLYVITCTSFFFLNSL